MCAKFKNIMCINEYNLFLLIASSDHLRSLYNERGEHIPNYEVYGICSITELLTTFFDHSKSPFSAWG